MSDETIDALLSDADERMLKSVENSREKFGTVRTGRASPALLDRVNVDYYGTMTPLRQMANIAAAEARLLTIAPYDKSALQSIEKAITDADLGLTPNNDGSVIRIQIPELTEERRTEMVKQVRALAEEGRIAIRNVRREVMHDLKELRTGGDVGEDDEKRAEADLQKLTDRHIGEIDALLAGKESDLLEV
ncbi:MAG: ribosome recycling factor [Solirubrobacterales bacterium]